MAISKSFEVKFENNANEVKKSMGKKKEKISYAIGLKWLEICTKIITVNGIVDTGRLRASLSFITPYESSGQNPFAPKPQNSESSDRIKGVNPDKDSIIVGSNVSYASKQELENPKGAFLKPSILNFKEDYQAVAEAIMKEEG